MGGISSWVVCNQPHKNRVKHGRTQQQVKVLACDVSDHSMNFLDFLGDFYGLLGLFLVLGLIGGLISIRDGTATYSDVQKIHQQLNFTNAAISSLVGQLNYVATRIDDIQTPIPGSSETYATSISKPFFKVDGVSHKDQEDFMTTFSSTVLLNQITQQLKALKIDTPSTSCLDKTCVQNISSTSETEESDKADDEQSINEIAQNFEDSSIAINKIRYDNSSVMRNYYTKPTPPDLNLKEEVRLLQIILMVNPSIREI